MTDLQLWKKPCSQTNEGSSCIIKKVITRSIDTYQLWVEIKGVQTQSSSHLRKQQKAFTKRSKTDARKETNSWNALRILFL